MFPRKGRQSMEIVVDECKSTFSNLYYLPLILKVELSGWLAHSLKLLGSLSLSRLYDTYACYSFYIPGQHSTVTIETF